jgi:hypothetical protein
MVYVTAIRLSGGAEHEHISSIKWLNCDDGKSGTMPLPDAVTWLESHPGLLQVADPAGPVPVRVYPRNDKKYLRTVADGKWQNNLLSLPPF